MTNQPDLQFPIGRFTIDQLDKTTTDEERVRRMAALAEAPQLFAAAVAGMTSEQLDTAYRPGGWTIRQLIHHVADSHLQAYIVFKFTLTVDKPIMRMYDSAAWGELKDATSNPVEISLDLMGALHTRWDTLLRSMKPSDFARSFERPEWGGLITLDNLLQMLEWHQCHHLRHIWAARERLRL